MRETESAGVSCHLITPPDNQLQEDGEWILMHKSLLLFCLSLDGFTAAAAT